MINLSATRASSSIQPASSIAPKKINSPPHQSFAGQLSQASGLTRATTSKSNPAAQASAPGQKTAVRQAVVAATSGAVSAQPALTGFAALAAIVGSPAVSPAAVAPHAATSTASASATSPVATAAVQQSPTVTPPQHPYASDPTDDAYWA